MAESQEYQVTARKWRPTEFESVVGQEHVTQTLKNAIRSGRLHHAYLFTGPRGVGKTTTARILAKALNCLNPSSDMEPCSVCDACRAITEGRSLDVVEIDGASNNSVEDVRKLRDNAKYPPINGRYKLYIIDEVHMLSTSAFNALLKTLEEPPKHLVFVFATTEPHKVPATILSRCQRFDFRRMQIEDIVGRLKHIAGHEGFEVDEDALVVIAKKADGSMRDSHSIFDQVTAFCGPRVSYAQANEALNLIDQEFFFRVTDMMRGHETADAFAIVEQIMRTGYDPQEFLIGLAEHLRNYLSVLTTGSTRLIEAARGHRERYGEEARSMEQGDVIRALHLVLAAQQGVRTSSQPRLRLELALIQLAVMDATVSLTELLEKIDRMPDQPGGAGPAPGFRQPQVTSSTRPAEPVPSPEEEPALFSPETPSSPAPSIVQEPAAEYSARRSTDAIGDLASFPTSAPAPPPVRGNGGTTAVASPTVSWGNPNGETANGGTVNGGTANGTKTNGTANGNGAHAATVDIRELQKRWPEFLRSCEDEMKSAVVTLQTTMPAEIAGSTVRLYVENEFQMTVLNRNNEALCRKLCGFFNTSLHLEGVIGAAPIAAQTDIAPAASISREQMSHPFIRGIVEMLGASPLP